MGTAIPGNTGLFGALQLGITHSDMHHVCITQHLRDHLTGFELLAWSIATQPTCLAELMPNYPSAIGSVDAAKSSMGGVLFADGQPPLLWCAPFPADIQAHIVSTKNPTGDIMNSDLEQAGMLAQADVMNLVYDLCNQMLATLNDNITAIATKKEQTPLTKAPPTYAISPACTATIIATITKCCTLVVRQTRWQTHFCDDSNSPMNNYSPFSTLGSCRTNHGTCAT